jgi:hypothetical protein
MPISHEVSAEISLSVTTLTLNLVVTLAASRSFRRQEAEVHTSKEIKETTVKEETDQENLRLGVGMH